MPPMRNSRDSWASSGLLRRWTVSKNWPNFGFAALARLFQILRLLGRRRQRVHRLDLTEQRVLDLLLREAIPLGIPRRADVFARAGGGNLLFEHLAVVAGLALRLDDVGIAVERLERVADAVFEVPVL